ncbi:tetratricopeptide repeat protein [Rasiella rasia]|uniref:Tetratricopeptide repeat protein n=1 Tax=Rasiella rasia TaxID=2744027 RepID=A0A6G6GKH6_9FLAO|nr:tetratricopeptide repeat protein [Rasiella rasia]QIE58990.1 tetratricopeptide repeat protein [Rasiella rasia]
MHKYLVIVLSLCFASCGNSNTKTDDPAPNWTQKYQAISKLGDTLYSKAPSQKLMKQYEAKKEAFDKSATLENTIWYGRFTAYTGNYREAIAIYTEGLNKFPDESRLLRHRGHRYITVREFDKAIIDLEKAAALIQGQENKVEEDGMPNAKNIPLSTMHGNIYYHLGLAYYLNGNDVPAIEAYKKCLKTSSNPDNVVSATHWIYTINCQIGRKSTGLNYVKGITADMNIIENQAYHKACLVYKGELQPEKALLNSDDDASNSALNYAIANYLLCDGQSSKAKTMFSEIVSGSDWASFGYIAAEVDLASKF